MRYIYTVGRWPLKFNLYICFEIESLDHLLSLCFASFSKSTTTDGIIEDIIDTTVCNTLKY